MPSVPNNKSIDESESLFDFLNDNDQKSSQASPTRADTDALRNTESYPDDSTGNRDRQPPQRSSGSEVERTAKAFPVIRKPVSVEQTGALRPPRPGEPIEPPPPLTDGSRKRTQPAGATMKTDNIDFDLTDLDFNLDDDDWPGSEQWVDQRSGRSQARYDAPERSGWRIFGYLIATLLIATGAAAALYSQPAGRLWVDNTLATVLPAFQDEIWPASQPDETPVLLQNEVATTPASSEVGPSADAVSSAQLGGTRSLNVLFRQELTRLETLVSEGALDEADQLLRGMDRAVYGYGAPEFTQIEAQLAELRQTDSAAVENAQSDQDSAAELDAARLASERQLAQAEVQRQAEQARVAAEAERLAQQTTDRQRASEQEQADLLRQRQAEQDARLSVAAQIQADRRAQEQARLEQLEVARLERLQIEQQRLEQASAEQLAATATFQAEDWQLSVPAAQDSSVEAVAARQREEARQQRLLKAQQRSQQGGNSEPLPAPLTAPGIEVNTPATASVDAPDTLIALNQQGSAPVARQPSTFQPITDADLQSVYQRFSELRSAIEGRDIETVLSLTERSGVRIQQLMQMFENNVSITARLSNVSTLDTRGEIQGTLQITRLERADGSVTGPPLHLSTVRLSAVRQGDIWSSIRW